MLIGRYENENDEDVKSGWSNEAASLEELLGEYPCDMENESIGAEGINSPNVLHSSVMDTMALYARFIHSTEEDGYLTNVSIAAKGNEYSGKITEEYSDPQLVDRYKRLVENTITRFNVPVELHGFVARQFLTGKMANLVLSIATRSPDKVLLKEQIFNIVDTSIKGSTQKLISCGESCGFAD
jgi:hypothetical protein